MTDPARPALIPGHLTEAPEPAFDPDAIAAQIDRPRPGPSIIDGEVREPARPMLPPAGVEIPEDLREAIAKSDAAYELWGAALDRVYEYEGEAQASRAKRAAAIKAAGAAEAAGKPRPRIPNAISEEAEAVEVQILSAVVDTRRREADATANTVSRLTLKHAGSFVDPVSARFAPAIAEAQEAVSAALRAVERAEGISGTVVSMRAMAHATALEDEGARLGRSAIPDLARSYAEAMQSEPYRLGLAHSRSALHLLSNAQTALNDLAATDLGAIPHPDTLGVSGANDGQHASIWRRLFAAAGPAQRAKVSALMRSSRLPEYSDDGGVTFLRGSRSA